MMAKERRAALSEHAGTFGNINACSHRQHEYKPPRGRQRHLRMFTSKPSRTPPTFITRANRGFFCRRSLQRSEISVGPTKFNDTLAEVPLDCVGFGGMSMA